MDGDIGFMEIKPDQVQLINPFLILVFIPLYEVIFYPLLNLVGIRRPLQKICLGGILGGVAFLLSAFVELSVEPTYPIMPSPGVSQLRVFNGMPCNYSINSKLFSDSTEFHLARMGLFEEKFVRIENEIAKFPYTLTSAETNAMCPSQIQGDFILESNMAISYFLVGTADNFEMKRYEDNPEKTASSSPVVRILANTRNANDQFRLRGKDGSFKMDTTFAFNETTEVPFGFYDFLVNDVEVQKEIRLRTGGVYSFMVREINANEYVSGFK